MLLASLALMILPVQDAARIPIELPENPYLSHELRQAMEPVFRLDRRLLDLGLLDGNGALADLSNPRFETDSEIVEFITNGEPGLFAGRYGFAFGELAPSFDQLVECGRYDQGLIAAKVLFAANPKLSTEELLKPIDDAFLEAEPVEGSMRAKRLHEFALRQMRLAPLSNGTVSYVIWGFMYLDEFWKDKPGEREQFITDLIERGASSQISGMTVRRILQAPLKKDPEQRGQGAAFFLLPLREMVGYTHKHQHQLEDLIKLVNDASKEDSDGPNPFDAFVVDTNVEVGAETITAADANVLVPTRLGHLSTWAPELLGWVLLELDPEAADENMRRAATIEERMSYWDSLANTVPFANFRERMLEEVRAMLNDSDENPLMIEIMELEALQEAGALSAEQEKELVRLRGELKRERRSLVRHLAELTAQAGTKSDYELAVSTLAVDLDGLLSSGKLQTVPGMEWRSAWELLYSGWLWISVAQYPGLPGVVEQVLHGEVDYPEYGTAYLINSLVIQKPEGYESILKEIMDTGTPAQRGQALINPDWMKADQYKIEISRLFAESRDPKLTEKDRSYAWQGAVKSLSSWDGPEAKALLMKSIEDGSWIGDPQAAKWLYELSPGNSWALEMITPAGIAKFKEQGLIDPNF